MQQLFASKDLLLNHPSYVVGNPAEEQVEVPKPRASFGPGTQHDSDLLQPPWGVGSSACPPALPGCRHFDLWHKFYSFISF